MSKSVFQAATNPCTTGVPLFRKLRDSIELHKTRPMLSSVIVSYWRSKLEMTDDNMDENDDAPTEDPKLRVHISSSGSISDSNQVHNYLYRSDQLDFLNFYDFVQYTELERLVDQPKNTSESRLGVCKWFKLKVDHPLHETHSIALSNETFTCVHNKSPVPRIIGLSVPRKDSSEQYALFMLAHLKSHSLSNPLVSSDSTICKTFKKTHFSDKALTIMNNWEAIHECEDKREAERIQKSSQKLRPNKTLNDSIKPVDVDNDDPDIINLDS